MALSQYDLLFKTRHPELEKRLDNWQLIYNSYVGGVEYSQSGYLIRYPKESLGSFGKRKERAVYFNQLSPIVDMLSGLLFLNEPARKIPTELAYLEQAISINGVKSLNEFMRQVAAYSFMFTCGVLIDSPDFDTTIIRTKKDRIDNKINPYAVLYLPFKIRDFNINNEDGQLDWVLLDNSYYDHTDPYTTGETVYKYTMWDRTKCVNFVKKGKNGSISIQSEKPHGLGWVPFRFVSWRDDNNDFIGETVCEDIAMISKLIYNNMSYMDEMLASGTFKMLAYPTKDGTAPDALTKGGVGPLSILPFPLESSHPPAFIGAELAGIDPFIKAITFYMTEILKKVGLSTDETKEFVKSGVAKKIDFQKMRALLISGAMMMSKLEEWMMATAAKWEGKNLIGRCDYTSSFSDEDLQTEVTLLTELLIYPVKSLRVNVLNLLTKKLLANYLEPDTLQEIYDDIKKNISSNNIESNTGGNQNTAKKVVSQNNKGEQK